MARRSTRKRPEATPEPAPAPAPAAASAEPKSATKKRRASPATKANPKKRKLNPDTPDNPEDKPKKTTKTAVKKKPASKRESAGKRTKTKFSEETKDSVKTQPNVSKEDSKVTKAKKAGGSDDEKSTKTETTPFKENSKVKKIKAKVSDDRKVAKKTTKDAEDIKKAFLGPKKSDKSVKTSSHESEAESGNGPKAAGSIATREDSLVTTSIPESGISEMAFSVAEADDDGQIGGDENPDSTADGSGHDIGTQRVSPLPSDLDATELETDIELSMDRMKSGEQHRARNPGDTPYQDHTLHPNTMLFLKDLKENNSRDWLKGKPRG